MEEDSVAHARVPWNTGKIIGQKAPLKVDHVTFEHSNFGDIRRQNEMKAVDANEYF